MGDFVGSAGGIARGGAGGFGIFDLRVFRLAGAYEVLFSGGDGDDEGYAAPFGQDVGGGKFERRLFLTASGREGAVPLTFWYSVKIDRDGWQGEVDDGSGD